MIKRINFWIIFAFLVPLLVAIPIFTVFLSFFDATSSYLVLLKDTFLLKYLSNSLLILLGVLSLTFIFGTYGIHPHEAKNDKISSDLIIKEIKNNNKIIGIGETGLDFYYNHSDKDDQIKSFEEHIKASITLNIPLIIHSRNAEDETLEIFNKYKKEKLKILMHCFTGSKKFAENLMSFGAFFSASGIVTFKNSLELQNTFKFIPLDKILIETDSPYLAPVPNRGKQNEPSFVKYTAQKLADIKEISNLDLIKITTKNFNTLFN